MNLQALRTTMQIESENADTTDGMGNELSGPATGLWLFQKSGCLESRTWSYLVMDDYKNVYVVGVWKVFRRDALAVKVVVVVD